MISQNLLFTDFFNVRYRYSNPVLLDIFDSYFKLVQRWGLARHYANKYSLALQIKSFFILSGGKSYAVRVSVNEEEMFYIGKDREAKFYERWCSVEVNGVKGRACVEWHYNNTLNKMFDKYFFLFFFFFASTKAWSHPRFVYKRGLLHLPKLKKN